MNRCPITYDECGFELYSQKGLKLISPALKELSLMNLTADELRAEVISKHQCNITLLEHLATESGVWGILGEYFPDDAENILASIYCQ